MKQMEQAFAILIICLSFINLNSQFNLLTQQGMSDYSSNLSNQLLSFRKSIASNNRQAMDKYLSQIKNLSEDFLNQALFWCIQNYKVEQQTDECLHILLRYTSQISKSKANPNCEINSQTPLIAACRKGQLSLVKRLIQNGAKPDLPNSQNKHPLQFLLFSRQQNYDVADYLLSQMQSVNFFIKNKYPIVIAVQRQFFRIFKSILEKGSQLVFQEGNLLHIILKQKFKSLKTKKKFLKQLTTKYNLFIQLDRNKKIPIDYQENQEIKAYYLENFKLKKAPQPVLNSVQKTISNNSSIFINTKSIKRETRPAGNDKRKNLYDSSSLINKSAAKQVSKQMKVQTKETKEDDVSFEYEIDDKSEGQIEEQDKYPEKTPKVAPQPIVLTGSKKTPTTKTTYNSSFVSNSSAKETNPSNYGLTANNSTVSKVKSKYSGIGPRTQTNLRNAFIPKKYEAKKPSGLNSSTTQNKESNNKKRSTYEDDKKQIGSSKKISISQDKTTSKEEIQISKEGRQEETQKLLQNDEQVYEQDASNNESPQNSQVSKEIQEMVKKQNETNVQTLQLENANRDIKLPEKEETNKQTKKLQWEITIQSCQKLMEQFIIKEEHQITNLKELKSKFNKIFTQYRSSKNIASSSQKIIEPQKLKELKTYNNESNKSIGNMHVKFNFQKQILRQQNIETSFLTEAIILIQSTCSEIAQKKINCIRDALQFITNKVQNVLQSTRKQKIQVSIEIYGSRANGLEIQASDTDLLIICNINAGVKDLMLQLQRSGAFNCKEINEVKFLANTSMPIMKLSLNSDFMHMNIDLTFQIRGHTGIRCTSLIKQFIEAEELLKPLVVTLKTLLNCYELCDTYTGGLGSYSLTLMTIALLQFTEIKKSRENLGEIFLEFLLFYGFQMDYICQAIIIHPPGFNERPAFSIYQLPYSLDLTPKLIIYDPLNPVNNVGRATYRIVQLKKLFKVWYVKLRTELSGRKDGLQVIMKQKDQLLQKTAMVQN